MNNNHASFNNNNGTVKVVINSGNNGQQISDGINGDDSLKAPDILPESQVLRWKLNFLKKIYYLLTLSLQPAVLFIFVSGHSNLMWIGLMGSN